MDIKKEVHSQRLFRPVLLDRFPRLKTRLGLSQQGAILGVIDRLPIASLRSRVLRRSLRHDHATDLQSANRERIRTRVGEDR